MKAFSIIKNCILNIIFPSETLDDKSVLEQIKLQAKTLDQYGGRMVVGDRGGMRHEFKTKQGEKAYYQSLRKKFEEDCKKAGYRDVKDFMYKWNNRHKDNDKNEYVTNF